MSYEIDGMAELQQILTDMTREFHGTQSRDMRSAMQRSLYRLIFTLADYPPQPPTTYRRTGTLGRRWTDDMQIDSLGDGIQGTIGNNTEYGPWVQSDQFQTRRHRDTGWITDKQALERNEDGILREFRTAIEEMVRG